MIHKTTRSILSVLLAALLLVTSTPLTPAFADGGTVSPQSANNESRELTGDGTEGDPYQIATANDLREFAQRVNNGQIRADANAILTDDINLNPGFTFKEDGSYSGPAGVDPQEWTPIGTNSNEYTGTFNGDGHTISGLTINSSDNDYKGLFGYVSTGGKVQNLSVSGSVKGKWYVGGVVGWNGGRVEDCDFTGSVSGSYVGGVVGVNGGNVINCTNTGTVTGTRTDDYVSYVGGVVGYNHSSVTNCYNTGTVTGPESGNNNRVGGVVGDNSGTVKNCYNTGSVSGDWYVGGVVGYNSGSSTVENCYNTGKVSDGTTSGGVVGQNSGSVTNCYFLQGTAGKGIGSGSGDTTSVTTLDALCDALKGDTTTWTISPFCKHPVLQANPEGGLGTATHPYEIKTIDQLKTFRDLVNDENDQTADTDAHAKLMNDINLNGNAANQWIPIGNSIGNSYEGTFNGDGHTISGLYIKNTSNITDYQGLFGFVGSEGTVQNLTVDGTVSGSWSVGGVVGYNNGGTVTGCTFSVSGTVSGRMYVGGVVGRNSGTYGSVTNCYNTGEVTGSTSGGVVGYNQSGTVENCYNTGTVSGSDYVGGVVGSNSGTVTNCYNTGSGTGTVTGTDEYVGGVVGLNGGTVENCYNTGAVNSSGNRVGGVVGDNGGNVENCYNTGTVNVSGNSSAVGGVVGCNQGGSVQNCYNTGGVNVTGTGNWVGGVVGWNSSDANVTNCYNTGKVSGSYVGGVVGCNDSSASVANCYYQTGKGATVGIGGTTADDTRTVAKTAEQFASGEVTYLLGEAWGQNLMNEPKDNYPQLRAFDAATPQVYKVAFMNDSEEHDAKYANSGMTVDLPATNPTKEGYTFAGWFTKSSGGSQWNFSTAVTENMTLYAQWTAVEDPEPEPTPDPEPEEPPYTGKYSYEVSTSVGDHGSLTVDRYATEGDKVTIDVTPDQAYKLDDLSVTANGKDVELTANSDGTYTFTMPSADVRITATFAEDPDWTEPEPEPSTDVSDLFIDIAPDAWYKDAVQYAYDNGLMTGVSDTEFAPEATTTRAMIVSILARLEGVTTAQAAGFADVDDNDWYATAVNWAANVGVVNGYEDNTFQPNTAITREQLAAILMNYAAYKGEDVSNRADLTSYTDQPSTWAQEAMQWAVAEGLISGVTNTELQPQGNATRAQVAAILQRFLSE